MGTACLGLPVLLLVALAARSQARAAGRAGPVNPAPQGLV
jgi:hypothetical protein